MLSVRLPETTERDLAQFCASRKLTKSQVVQAALAEYFVAAKTPTPDKAVPSLICPSSRPVTPFVSSLALPKTA